MPYKDPEKKRAYDREYRRRRGDEKRNAELKHALWPVLRPGLRQCPFCERWNVQKKYVEDGSWGYWCPHCLLFIAPPKELKGVGGWLLFLYLQLIFIGPIRSAYSLLSNYIQLMPYFKIYKGLFAITIIDFIISIGIISFSIYAGINLLRIKRNAVEIAISYFLLLLAYEILSPLLLLVVSFPREFYKEATTNVVRNIFEYIIICAIWLTYLHKSKRVKNTYGELADCKDTLP